MTIIETIEARLTENKSDTKTYKTYERANATAAKLADQFEAYNGVKVGVEYTVVMLPNVGRWTVVFNLTKWLNRANTGTYLGWFAQKGFFSI